MSMSTRIDDLPGPPPERAITPPPPVQMREMRDESIYQEKDHGSNVTANIKRVSFSPEIDYDEPEKEGLLTTIKNEINEENLFILLIIYIATTQNISSYISKLPFVGIYANDSILGGFMKAIILFMIYIILKIFILPKIRI